MFRDEKHEFICNICGAAFRVLSSRRKQDAERLMAVERKQRVPTPTDPARATQIAKEQYTAACKRKFKELKHARRLELCRAAGADMETWLASDEARELRERLKVTDKRVAEELQS